VGSEMCIRDRNREAAGSAIAQTLIEEEPNAKVDSYAVTDAAVTVNTSEPLMLPFSVFTQAVNLHAHATARLVVGYDSPA